LKRVSENIADKLFIEKQLPDFYALKKGFLVIITAWLACNKAEEHGRNVLLWAVIGAAVFIGTQFATALTIGVGSGFLVAFGGFHESIFDDLDFVVRIVAIATSIFASWLLLRYRGGPAFDDEPDSPPPPPSFGGN
jgi:hypothetical protein